MSPTASLETDLADRAVLERTQQRFRQAGIALPTFAELAEPWRMPAAVREALAGVDPDAAHPLNLFRVHWWNARDRRGRASVPDHLVLGPEFTGVPSPIVLAIGDRFPMIRAHKVLAAYACLVPRLVTGRFDPTRQRAVWPSTGNYCRGGVAISRILGCRGVAVLPEGMSAERFEWLERWVSEPGDVLRTPGTESNVKEIYDACKVLARDPANVILNQFSEFGNHLAHLLCTSRALEAVVDALHERQPGWKPALFVSASGSAGTLAAGDRLKELYGSRTVAVEALECPTMLENGFGEHNIQGIGDKHIPLIHNVMNTDVVAGVSDRATDQLSVMFAERAGLEHLRARGVGEEVLERLPDLGLSSVCNLLAAVKVSRRLALGPDDLVLTVATDGAALYPSEHPKILRRDFPGGFGAREAEAVFRCWMLEADPGETRVCDEAERRRIFNLGYYTWVEQQGVSIDDFTVRRSQTFWRSLREAPPRWDELIGEFNAATGVRVG